MENFVNIPVPERYAIRVMQAIVAWDAQDAAEPNGSVEIRANGSDAQHLTIASDGWADADLLRLIRDTQHKTMAILRSMMDLLSEQPGRGFTMEEIVPVTGHPRASVANAMTKLQPHFDKWYDGRGLPFVRTPDPAAPCTVQRHPRSS
ncbi:hypothetical protein HC251_14065 [Iamia sp. SCSIO 61187]|uniref:hypothetical protein n=1 Tax=Iamia sp. SCSIO 61187 TaxID=2722752 RepID=UPI001C624ED4|nr:hypothetical protein [Iamia sp. SCSIO 61187]QYG93437.1 hypothetical protein HC251_14065 [Iamia sp. SCSIO 61187]